MCGPRWLGHRPYSRRGNPILLNRATFGQFFQDLNGPVDPQQRFAQVLPLLLYFLQLELTPVKLLSQSLKPSSYFFLSDVPLLGHRPLPRLL